jgi:hypothetical protein
MSEMTLFKNNPMVNSDLFKSLQEMNENLSGGSTGGTRRISIKGGRFRLLENGTQVSVSKANELNVIIVNAAKISRMFYAGTYDPEKTSAPACWSADTQRPSADVPEETRQSSSCAICPMNVKGSGQGNSRACRFSQRLAITLEGKPEEVYEMQIPATSIFGEAKGTSMGMQAYAKLLHAHNTPAIAVMTEMSFDEESETPKLRFRPARPLEEDELQAAVAAKATPEAIRAITMTVSAPKSDAPKQVGTSYTQSTSNKIVIEDEVDEPRKVVKKAAPATAEKDLGSIVDNWDDE